MTKANQYFSYCAKYAECPQLNRKPLEKHCEEWKGLTQVKSTLPPNWKSLTLKGVGVEKKIYTVTNK